MRVMAAPSRDLVSIRSVPSFREDPRLLEGVDPDVIDVRTEQEARDLLKEVVKLPKDLVWGIDVEWDTPAEEKGQWKYERKDGHLGCTIFSWQISAGDDYPELSKIFFRNWGPYAGHSLRVFKSWIEDREILKTGHNYRSDKHLFQRHHISMNGIWGDGQDLDWLLDEQLRENKHALKECMVDHFGYDEAECQSYSDWFSHLPPRRMLKTGRLGKQSLKKVQASSLREVVTQLPGQWYKEGGIARLINYAVKDPLYSTRLAKFLQEKLMRVPWVGSQNRSMWDFYKKFERAYWRVLWKMEHRGLPVNVQFLEEVSAVIDKEATQVERKFLKAVVKELGTTEGLAEFNIGSSRQIAELLYQRLGYKVVATTKPSKKFPQGQPQADDNALMKLVEEHPKTAPVVEPIQTYRSLTKLNSTYAMAFITKCGRSHDGRLHTTIRRTLTTGRLGSSGPNLMNLPDPSKGTDEFGIRDSIEAPEGRILICGDLSQIEMRLLAHFSRDEALLNCFNSDPEIDTHCEAARWLNPELQGLSDDVIKHEHKNARSGAKIINFGLAYGMTEYKLSRDMKCSVEEALVILKRYFQKYRGIKQWIEGTKRTAHETQHVRTFLRRYARCQGINSAPFGLQKEMERSMVNAVIQGSAADLILCSMLLIENEISNPIGERLVELDTHLLMQVHDELLLEGPEEARHEALALVNEAMSNPYPYLGLTPLRCKTPADVAFGRTWFQAKGG